MNRYLVVANRTLGGSALAAKIRECIVKGDARFHLVVPAAKPPDSMTWTEGEAHEHARERLRTGLDWFASIGAQATGEIGDANPMLAIGDALIAQTFDEIILSTLPLGVSRWLRQDLPARVRRAYGIPVEHVVGDVPARKTA